MLAVITSGIISAALLALLIGGIGAMLRARWSAIVDALMLDHAAPPARLQPVRRAVSRTVRTPGPATWRSPSRSVCA